MGGTPSREPTAVDLKRPRPTLGEPSMQGKTKQVNLEETAKFSEEMLESHNQYRALHRVPPLRLNKKLSSLAQEWSERLTMIGMAESRPANKYGENIYWSRWASEAKSVCASWYKEGKHYKYDKEPDPPPINNYPMTHMLHHPPEGIILAEEEVLANNERAWYVCCGDPMRGLPYDCQITYAGPKEFPKALVDPTFHKLMLRLTNEYRFVHGAKFLRLSPALSELAQKEAENMATLKKLEPSANTRFGGTYYASKWSYEPKDVTQFWYQESKRFKFGREPDVIPLSTCDFTQMIWVNSNEVGYGRAQASNGFVYVVAYYRPRGNIRGEFVKNVKSFNFDAAPTGSDKNSVSFDRKRSVSRAVAVPQLA